MKTLKNILIGAGVCLYGTTAILLMLSEPAEVTGLWTNAVGCIMTLAAALYLQHIDKKA